MTADQIESWATGIGALAALAVAVWAKLAGTTDAKQTKDLATQGAELAALADRVSKLEELAAARTAGEADVVRREEWAALTDGLGAQLRKLVATNNRILRSLKP